ncbi:kinesin-like protein Klp61F [Athalia rosae]|uniref:kinesin-like protein Klp61F n=1 Tax=Athalia rosae TaxID=37344 RepID=UPI002033BB42|nr:kinesin-like protein Klp61F [Athalia rosae]XP_048515073.1 kinesin-like protein Klp61F [Athalia rosae]
MNETRFCKQDKNQHIQVFVRVRPTNNVEKLGKSCTVVDVPSNKEVVVRERPQDKHSKKFTFDKVFGPMSKQVDVYKAVVSPLLEEVLAGYNCTVFAYGQTGTGKTFTMEGVSNDPTLHWQSDTNAGIIPRSLSHLFDELHTLDAQEYSVRVSFLELYNEELFDLLSATDNPSKIRLYEDASKKGSVIIHGLEEAPVHNKGEVYKILQKGSEKRQTAATLMNAHSSRSHTIFSITVHIKENTVDGEELLKTGKLNLVDLAGSENVGRSGAVDRRAREAGNINQSLLTLGRVITSLVERAPHIPYRESKLTRLLQESLGGRTKTSIIATVSPASINLEETLSTLDYAHRAKNITNRPELNQKLSKKALLKEYTEEIERLQRDLLATRERNGVYLAQENYLDMQAQIEYQKKDIADKCSHIKVLEEEMDKKEKIFNDLQVSLDIHRNDLRNTESLLANTKDVLEITETQLLQTKQECAETKHLVEKHVATEKILSAQARQLLEVAEVATTDTYKLHDKIGRKSQVEQENDVLGKQFQRDVTNRVEEIERNCTEYTQNLVQFCMNMKDVIGAQMATQNSCINVTIQHVSKDLVADQSRAVKRLTEQADCSFNRCKTWVDEHLKNVTIMSDHESKLLNEISLMLAPKIEELVKTNIEKNLQVLREDVTKKLEEIFTYVDSSTKDICNSLVMGRDHLFNHTTKIREYIQAAQTKQNEIIKTNQTLNEAFENVFSGVCALREQFAAAKTSHRENHTEIAKIFTNISDTNDGVCSDGSMFCGNNVASEERFDAEIKEKLTEVKNEIQSGIEENITIANITAVRGQELTVQLQSKLQANGKAWIIHRHAVEKNLGQLQEATQQNKDMILLSAQELQKITNDASVNHEEIMENYRSKTQLASCELQHKFEEQGANAAQWGAGVTAQLRTTQHQVEKFLAEDLRQDVPTGGTPVRKEHYYPKQLAATSPHDRIIQRFRVAMNEVVPEIECDDKENDEDESSKSVSDQLKQMIPRLKPVYSNDRRVLGSHN